MTNQPTEDNTSTDISDSLHTLLAQIGKSVTPTPDEKRQVEATTTTLTNRLHSAVEDCTSIDASAVEIVPTGSTSRDTFLAGDSDIDLFVRFPTHIKEEYLESFGLAVGEQALPTSRKEYADHPYITGEFDGFDIDIVPCFAVENASNLQSPVDRTPFHTEYLSEALDEDLKHDIRIAKRFLKASGVYGANAKTQGFSGFITELLLLKYGSIEEFLKAVADWGEQETIDIEDHATKTFTTPLAIIDPVDPNRNAAAAVNPESKAQLMLSTRQLLAEPKNTAFEDTPTQPLNKDAIERFFKLRDTHPIALEFEIPDLEDETLYPQLVKSRNGLVTLLKEYNFEVVRTAILTTAEEKRAIFIFECKHGNLPAIERHVGPPIWRRDASRGFINAYENDHSVTGPFIDGNKLVVEREREIQTVEYLLGTSAILNAQHGTQIKQPLATTLDIISGPENVADLVSTPSLSRDLRPHIFP